MSSPQHRRSRVGQLYLSAVPWVGMGVLAWALTDLVLYPPDSSWLALAALTILTGSFTVKVPGLVARLSVSEPFVFAATLWFGPSVGAVTAALDALIMSLWLMPGLKTVHRLSFNIGVLVISIWTASQVFFGISDINVREPQYPSLTLFVGPLYIFTATCFLLNSGMVAAALSIERGQSGLKIWREQFLWLSVNYFSGASVAALLVVYAKSIDWAVIGLIVPLLAISYLTFRTTLGRLEDANTHLKELNRLHLETIETLAMAVDAKDQITHGHIRRVQRHALGLSSFLGIGDHTLLKAVEAAALLHDMGKLAIPEYILNKPGKLTPAEFEKMKLHAALGADILSAIQFPYPVIPIVRHHHENWDGTGYPDGLRGTNIPLGARILSVVDCYDALTSDRPYRAKLSTQNAVEILMQRRGSMYDPLVVDTFVARLSELEALADDIGPLSPTLSQIAKLNVIAPTQNGVRESVSRDDPMQSYLAPSDVAGLAIRLAGRPMHVLGCVFYMSSSKSTDLVAVSVSGSVPKEHLGDRVVPGARIIGWATSTCTAVLNAPAALELKGDPFPAATCSAFPVKTRAGMLAVLAVFADSSGLSDTDRVTFETVSRELAAAVLPEPNDCIREGRVLDKQLVHSVLPVDKLSTSASFPIGVLAARVASSTALTVETARSVVRATDNVIELDNGTYVFILQGSSAEAIHSVSERLKQACETSGIALTFEWALLEELTHRTASNVSDVISTLGSHFIGRISAKLH